MKRLFIICCAMSLLCFTACSKSAPDKKEQNQRSEQDVKEADGQEQKAMGQESEAKAEEDTKKPEEALKTEMGFYIMEADADTTVTPAIELDGTDGTFMFLNDVLLSVNTQGTFEVKDGVVTAKSDDGKKTYLFRIEGEDSLRFMQDGSSKIMLSDAENNEKFLADKAEFKRTERMPDKEEVLAMRRKVLDGMTEEDKETLTNNIKAANEGLERNYIYDNFFERLSDPEDSAWNALEKGNDAENAYDADTLVVIVQEMKDSLKNDLLKDDLESIIQNIYKAKETHDVECVKQIYYTVHDMDYFLLRYGIEDVGKHIPDMSAVSTYYGALNVYR